MVEVSRKEEKTRKDISLSFSLAHTRTLLKVEPDPGVLPRDVHVVSYALSSFGEWWGERD